MGTVIGTAVAMLAAVSPASAAPGGPASPVAAAGPAGPGGQRAIVAYSRLALPGGAWARVWSDGIAEVHKAGRSEIQHVPLLNREGGAGQAGAGQAGDGIGEMPSKGQLISDLAHGVAASYAAGQVVVVYRGGAGSAAVSKAQAGLGVDRTRGMFSGASQQRASSLRDAAQRSTGHSLLDFSSAEVLHVTAASVPDAVAKLRADTDVAYAAPDWTVGPTYTPPVPVPAAVTRQASSAASHTAATAASPTAGPTAAAPPGNYALTASAQSMLNRPADDVVPAYTALARYGQFPGQGEIITNVSLGTLDDASAAANQNDACNFYAANYGPTTEVIGGQRYLDWPSMPLIPTYTASAAGALDPGGETCGDDPTLTEIGLDFSMMAPLPHDKQRQAAVGSGLTDLLGIAPGASYRLVVPATPGGAVSDVDAAFLAAATQTPRPDVITASLGFGLDSQGFASRYLEDDPMTEAILASITASGIVVCVSAGDGLRTATNAAVAPSGGAVATNVAKNTRQQTDLNDVAFSGAPSADLDSGAIDVGGSTLNDIFAAPPVNPANAATSYLQAYPATRYDGGRLYASGFGSRVNVSAPGDNVLSFSHPFGGTVSDVQVDVEGGTSASAPQAAAAAAIVLQVAKLTHDRALEGNPLAVRKFLASTGTALPAVPQSDTPISVGPQIDAGRAVQTLLAGAGQPVAPGVARVAVAQRQQASALGGSILTATDPGAISLAGRLANAWITISPDWTGLPRSGVTYRLRAAAGPARQLATTPWARLQPSAILAAAGLPLASAQDRAVPLAYSAVKGGKVIASADVTLTFGPTDGAVPSVQAPLAPAVENGPVIPVRYDIGSLAGATSPTLVVSEPGRVDPVTGQFFRTAYTAALTAPSGTVDVPVSALPGSGIYGIGLQNGPGGSASANDSAYVFTRVVTAGSARPEVPTLSAGRGPAGHYLEIPYRGSFQLHYDARAVPGATGAIAEFSAPGPTPFNNYSTFNNPNGSERDDNGHDSGSVAYVPLPGVAGTATLNGGQLGLDPTMNHVVRVLATAHGKVTGEASNVVSISMDGIAAADGGTVVNGFGVSATGTDGFITSDQTTTDGGTLGSVETFDQRTGAVSTDVSSSHEYGTVDGCAGIFGGDTGMYDDFDPVAGTDTFRVLSPVAAGTIGGTWTPPAALGSYLCAADSRADSLAASQGGSQAGEVTAVLGSAFPSLSVAAADFATGSTGTPVDVGPALASLSAPSIGGFAQAAGHAYVAVTDAVNPSGTGTIADVDLASGAVATFPGVTTDFFSGLAANPSASLSAGGTGGVAIAGSYAGFGVYDLGTGAGTLVQPGGTGYQHPAAIPGTSDFLVQEVAPPDFSGTSPNNNAMSSVIVIDEHGNVLHRYERFNFYNIFLVDLGDYLQAGPTTSTAFTLGPLGAQLAPFSYSAG
jgi:hypothetical protein